MACGLQLADHSVFVFGIDLGEAVRAGKKVGVFLACLQLQCLEVGDTLDVGQADPLADLAGHREGIAGEHLNLDAHRAECGNELAGVRSWRIIEGNQSHQGGRVFFIAARHRQRAIAFCRGIADVLLECLDRWHLEAAGFGNGPHSSLHYPQALPAYLDEGFGSAGFRIEGGE